MLAITGLMLFLKITRSLRERREGKRRRAALRSAGGGGGKGVGAGAKSGRRRGRGRNAFEEEEWQGVPVRAIVLEAGRGAMAMGALTATTTASIAQA